MDTSTPQSYGPPDSPQGPLTNGSLPPAAIPNAPLSPPANPSGLAPGVDLPIDQLTALAIANAKRIVQTYAADPYTQSQQLQKLRTTYLRDRYKVTVNVAGTDG